MARDGRDDAREDEGQTARGDMRDSRRETSLRSPEPRDPTSGRPGVPMDRLTLPRGPEREPVQARGQVYRLRESEARMLATVGAFRVVRADDLPPTVSGRDTSTADVRSLTEQGLVQTRTVEVNRELTMVVALTRAGKDVLEAHRAPGEGRAQAFHAGLVKPREIAHDSQLYRLYQAEAERIERDGGHVTRVTLDYELKRDYQTFLNRPEKPADADRADEMEAFAAASGLPIVEGHLELPDLRIEYATADGRLEHRDVELVTEHYSRTQLAGKAAAGFTLYRAAGAGRGRGGTPDPHLLERLLR